MEDCWDDVCLGGTLLQVCSSKTRGFADELALQGILQLQDGLLYVSVGNSSGGSVSP